MNASEKDLILFDMDGTLCVSKAPLDGEMLELLAELLRSKPVGVISGGSYKQFGLQLGPLLDSGRPELERFYLFPTCASVFYRYRNGWVREYSEDLTEHERNTIFASFATAFKDIGYDHPETLYGEVIEDRETQVTFSALGQQAPPEMKKRWRDANPDVRDRIRNALSVYLPEFEIRFGGLTSVDVTHKGIDKAYGIGKIEQTLGIGRERMFFVGDDLGPNGNDYPVKRAGVDCEAVAGPEDTKNIIRRMLA